MITEERTHDNKFRATGTNPAKAESVLTASSVFNDLHPDQTLIELYEECFDFVEAPRTSHRVTIVAIIAALLNYYGVAIRLGGLTLAMDLWVLMLAKSGFGKNTALGFVKGILRKAGFGDIITSATPGSREGFLQALAERPHGLYLISEFPAFSKRLASPQFAGLRETLTDMFDNPDPPDAIRYRQRGDLNDTPAIEFDTAPRINFLAACSLQWFRETNEYGCAEGGWLARFILPVIDAGDEHRLVPIPRQQRPELEEIIASRLKAISTLKGTADLSQIEGTYEEWYVETAGRFSKIENQDLASAFFNRLRVQVLKLAVVFEVSRSCSLAVSEESWTEAVAFAHSLEDSLTALIGSGFSSEGGHLYKMREFVRKGGADGVSLSAFTKRFSETGARARSDRIRTLWDAGELLVFKGPATGGRPPLIYVHGDFAQAHAKKFPAHLPVKLLSDGEAERSQKGRKRR